MFYDLGNQSSQLVICNVWLHWWHVAKWDMTNYFDYHCNTWVAPKPTKFNEATAVYRTLSSDVWMGYGFFFFLTVAMLAKISQIESKFTKTEIKLSHFERCFLEATNTATAHATAQCPQQLSIRILLLR